MGLFKDFYLMKESQKFGMTREEAIENYKKHILPKYSNGKENGMIAVLIKTTQSNSKISYGVQFQKNPKIGHTFKDGNSKIEIIEILGKE